MQISTIEISKKYAQSKKFKDKFILKLKYLNLK
jgi:hypothetical protein